MFPKTLPLIFLICFSLKLHSNILYQQNYDFIRQTNFLSIPGDTKIIILFLIHHIRFTF